MNPVLLGGRWADVSAVDDANFILILTFDSVSA